MTKLTDDDARLAYELLTYREELQQQIENLSTRAVGELFGVSKNTIWNLWNGSTHSWLAQERARRQAQVADRRAEARRRRH